tara:strand:- start:158 stop:1075 length:918 start_codon:yes stop_codon:yes gene_type:complete
MEKKNFYYNSILQFSLIFIIISLFYFEKLDINKIKFLLNFNFFYIILLLLLSRLLVSLLFSYILKILIKKGSIFEITSIYLKGGFANEAIPGLGYFYRYKKLKDSFSISLTEYGFVQSLNNIFVLLSYLILVLSFGFVKIEVSNNLNLIFMLSISLIALFLIVYNYRLKLFYFEKFKKVYDDISIIKKKIFKNYLKFLMIFFLYLLQSFFQCYIFYKLVFSFHLNLSFMDTSYLFISSLLVTSISLINYVGVFELALSFASSFFTDNYVDMWFIGISFRIMTIIALLLIISLFYFVNLFKKYEKI